MTIKDVKNFFGKEKDISEFIHYQLKIVTHQGGIFWRVIRYVKIYPQYNLASIIKFLVHRSIAGLRFIHLWTDNCLTIIGYRQEIRKTDNSA